MPVFGVPRLDDAFAQQAPRQPTLLLNDPGVDAMPFLLQAIRKAIDAGRDAVLLSADRAPHRVARMLHLGDDDAKRLHVLDAFSGLHGIPEPEVQAVDASNIAELVSQITEAAQRHPGALLVVDSLNGLLMRQEVEPFAASAPRFYQAIAAFDDAIVSYTQWGEELGLRSLLARFPHRVRLQAVEDRIISHQYFRVEAVSGIMQDDPGRILYRADDDGVRVYVPKVVVTGPADAGKTTFVHAVSDQARSVERLGATVAMDRGRIDHDGLRVDIFGTPGQERFDPLHASLLRQAVGIILVVDAADPDTFPRALQMLRRAWREGVPAVVAANKQDLDGALGAMEVQERLGGPASVPVLACSAKDPQGAFKIMEHLLNRIIEPQEITA